MKYTKKYWEKIRMLQQQARSSTQFTVHPLTKTQLFDYYLRYIDERLTLQSLIALLTPEDKENLLNLILKR